ncbi:MAG: MdtA/MuxA family multidrug efflux RND transporter periplasmic adaptor subunit [Bryobacteraceae bacterium]
MRQSDRSNTSPTMLEGTEVRTAPIPPLTAPPRKRRSFAWIWLLILAALGYGGFRYYQASQQKQQAADKAQAARMAPRSVPVVAVPSRLGDVPIYLRGLGSVTPFNTVAVKSRVDGQLMSIHYQEGQFVKKGDLLAEIDPRPFQVQLDQAQGALARDTAQLNDAKANLARYQALWQEKVIAKQQLDTQAASVGQFEGTLEADRAAIDNMKLQLSFTKITAPLTGRVGLRLVDVGNMVHASDPNGLVVIDQLQPIAALFTIPADNLPPVLAHLRSGRKMPVEAYDRDDKNKLATGTLLTVDNQIDPSTGTSRLKAVFPNSDSALFPNQFVNCRMLLDTKTGVVIVPVPAVQRGPQGSYVYVVTPDKSAAVRLVTVGITEGNNVSIDKGLAPNEMVIVDGQDKLQDGSKVDVRTQNGGPAAGASRRRVKK